MGEEGRDRGPTGGRRERCVKDPSARERELGTAQVERDPRSYNRVFRKSGFRLSTEMIDALCDEHSHRSGLQPIISLLKHELGLRLPH